jgi:hypothetical protein
LVNIAVCFVIFASMSRFCLDVKHRDQQQESARSPWTRVDPFGETLQSPERTIMKLSDLKIGTRLYIGFGMISAILVILVSVAYANFARLGAANDWNVHTYDVRGCRA